MDERSSSFYVSHASFGDYLLTVHHSDADSSESGFDVMVFDRFGGELSRSVGADRSETQAEAEAYAEKIAREHALVFKQPIAEDAGPVWKAGAYFAWPKN